LKNNNTICHVGFTKTPGDTDRIMRVMEWLHEKKIPFPAESRFMDLNKGEDFLSDRKRYWAVVLHFICRWEKAHLDRSKSTSKQLKVSPKASWSNWRKRLVNTKAKYIFLFGGQFEVSGGYIVNLDGYRAIQISPEITNMDEFWIYEKIT
jgi:hypothetical protein